MISEISQLKKGEIGLPLSTKTGEYLFILCFPGSYALGMASLGYQSVMKLVFDTPNWRIERYFSDTGDRTLENGYHLASADIIGFSIGFEIEIFSLIRMLQGSGMSVFSQDRTEHNPWIVIGGSLAALNPEIIAPFADIIVIGESEEIIPLLLDAWEESDRFGFTRREALLYFSRFPGLYIPQLYHPHYQGSTLIGFEKEKIAPEQVKRQWVDINRFETRTYLYTPHSHFTNTALMEINRGCHYRCRFCAGSIIYRPLRQRNSEIIADMIDHLRSFSDHMGIVGADVLSHPEWADIMNYLIKRSITTNFSSLSAVTLFHQPDYLPLLSRLGLKTLTLAPESGDELSRKLLGKDLSNEEWLTLLQQIFNYSIPKVKLYFMLGNPTSSAENDLEFLDSICRRTGCQDRLMVSYSFLVPKPQTALESMRTPLFSLWKKEKEIFEKGLKKLRIRFSGESLRVAWIELILARGDRQLAQVIPSLLKKGTGLSFDQWRSGLESIGRDLDQWPRQPWGYGFFPWSIIDKGIGKIYCTIHKEAD